MRWERPLIDTQSDLKRNMIRGNFAAALRAGGVICLCACAPVASAVVSFADITQWVGNAPGQGVAEAALVVDFRDGQRPLWIGYRWPTAETRTGKDLLDAVIGAGTGLTADSTVFVSTFSLGARSQSYNNNGTADYNDDSYWGYWTAETNPYTGSWTESQVGAATRVLASGSWDGWSYGPFGTLPVAPIPEPGAVTLVLLAGVVFSRRNRALLAA
jgi:hypothetical protein